MPFDIGVVEESFGINENRSWLKSTKGFDTCRSVTLDVSAFSAAHIAGGAIPSGTVLALLASGKYGPYVPQDTGGVTTDDVTPTWTITRTATGGVVTPILNGKSGDDLAVVAATTAAAIQAALRAISNEFASVTVTGADGGPFTVTGVGFDDDLTFAIDDSDATGGTVVVAAGTAGATGTSGTAAGLLFNTTPVGSSLARAGTVDLTTAADVGVPMLWEGIVDYTLLPVFAGTDIGQIDAEARADLPSIRWENG